MGYRIEIVTDDCMSSGKCVSDFPAAFAFDDDELGSVIDDGAALSRDEMIAAARNCPSRAVQVFDDDGAPVQT